MKLDNDNINMILYKKKQLANKIKFLKLKIKKLNNFIKNNCNNNCSQLTSEIELEKEFQKYICSINQCDCCNNNNYIIENNSDNEDDNEDSNNLSNYSNYNDDWIGVEQ